MMTCKSLINGHVGNGHFVHYRGCPLSEVILYHVYTTVILGCPLNGDLSSFGVSFISGSTVSNSLVILLFVARYTIAYFMTGILQMKSS